MHCVVISRSPWACFLNQKVKGWILLPILIDWLGLPGPSLWDGELGLISNAFHGTGLAALHRSQGFIVPGLAYLRSLFDGLPLNRTRAGYIICGVHAK